MAFDSGTMSTTGPHRPRRYSKAQQQAPQSTLFEGATNVDDLLAYVERGSTDEEVAERASAVLTYEEAKPAGDQRVTLVEPLTAYLETATASDTADPDDEEESDED